MYSMKCIDRNAVEEVLTILEESGYKAHLDGPEVKTCECINEPGIVSKIFPFKAYTTADCDGTHYD